jgi:hypothetical protein
MERSRLAAAFQLNLNMKPRLWFAQRLVDSVRHVIIKNFLLKVRARVRAVDLFQRKKNNFWVRDRNLGAGLRVVGPGTPPFWRTRKDFCTVWNSAR